MYKSAQVSDDNSNGGLLSPVRALSTVKNNIFPDVTDSDRLLGVTRYRKVFCKVDSSINIPVSDFKVVMSANTPAQDYVVMMKGTQRDVQSDIIANPGRIHAACKLIDSVVVGQTQFQVLLEDTNLLDALQTGDTIWLGDYETGEFHEDISVDISDTQVTITLDSGDQVLNNYNKINSYVCTVMEYGELSTSFDSVVINSVSGHFDASITTVLLDNIGTIEQDWTITMVNTNQFTCSGHTVGHIGMGYIDSTFAPENPDFQKPYFTILDSAWSGSWISNDSVKITTHPITAPIWLKNVVPTGCDIYLNTFELMLSCSTV